MPTGATRTRLNPPLEATRVCGFGSDSVRVCAL